MKISKSMWEKRNKNIFLDIFIWNYNVVRENALTNLQKDILRTIYQMRKWKEDDKQIKRILVLDYDLTEYYWKSNIKKLQEEGFLETDSDAKIPALTESGTEYARQLQRQPKAGISSYK